MRGSAAVTPLCHGCHRCDVKTKACAAGILILDEDASGRWHLILVQDRRTGEYSEPGGRFDSSDGDIAVTARRETLEETRNCADISLSQLARAAKFEKQAGRHNYTCYVVKTSGISCRKFYRTDVSRMPAVYQETSAMTRFPLDTMKALYRSTGKIVLTADNGEVKVGRDRCLEVLEAAFRNGML